MVEGILRTAGYRTALFTSPHLCDVRERFRINGCAFGAQGYNGTVLCNLIGLYIYRA